MHTRDGVYVTYKCRVDRSVQSIASAVAAQLRWHDDGAADIIEVRSDGCKTIGVCCQLILQHAAQVVHAPETYGLALRCSVNGRLYMGYADRATTLVVAHKQTAL